jgi:GNAT superfamily N-acetyltransferase
MKTQVVNNWFVKQMKPQDEESYLNFLAHRITRIEVSDHYNWLYRDNPHGAGLTWLAIHSKTNDIIGCTSIFPRRMWLNGKLTSGSVGGDLFVNHRFRRQGMASALLQKSIPEMSEHGVDVRYGFADARPMAAFRKAGAYFPFTMQELGFSFRRGASLARRLPLLAGLQDLTGRVIERGLLRPFHRYGDETAASHLKTITQFDERFDALHEELLPNFGVCPVRDSHYLNWRYFENPTNAQQVVAYEDNGRLLGFAALEFAGEICYLVDLFAHAEHVPALIGGVVSLAYNRHVSFISTIVNPHGSYYDYFIEQKFRPQPSEMLFQFCMSEDFAEKEALQNASNWYLAFADYDVESIAALGRYWVKH